MGGGGDLAMAWYEEGKRAERGGKRRKEAERGGKRRKEAERVSKRVAGMVGEMGRKSLGWRWWFWARLGALECRVADLMAAEALTPDKSKMNHEIKHGMAHGGLMAWHGTWQAHGGCTCKLCGLWKILFLDSQHLNGSTL
jgi:hypothetical protein